MKKITHKRIFMLLLTVLVFTGGTAVYAQNEKRIEFGPEDTEVTGSIKYSVVGRYNAQFDKFQGVIVYDQENDLIRGVELTIDVNSIRSNCNWCDDIVRSKRLLDVEQHPNIIFKSSKIYTENGTYTVKGTLDMHGVQKELTLPFQAQIMAPGDDTPRTLIVEGKWIINRKEFDIYWNRLLDKGGILVGNHITVDWNIERPI